MLGKEVEVVRYDSPSVFSEAKQVGAISEVITFELFFTAVSLHKDQGNKNAIAESCRDMKD